MKKVRVIILILVLVLSQFAIGFAEDALAVQKERQYKQAEYDGFLIYNEIINHYTGDKEVEANFSIAVVNSESEVKADFPESYGGAYIDPKTGKLVVCTTVDALNKSSFISDVNSIAQVSAAESVDNVTYKDVKYSYNTIMKVIDEILPQIVVNEKHAENKTVVGYYPRFTENQVVIEMEDMSNDKIKAVTSYVSEKLGLNITEIPLLRFQESPDMLVEEVALNSGSRISILSSISALNESYASGSVGFRAKKIENGVTKYGFVTAAHVCDYAVTDVWKNATGVGHDDIGETVLPVKTPSVDAVFVELLSGNTVSTEIDFYTKQYTASGIYNVVENMEVYKSGYVTYLTPGIVTCISYANENVGVSDSIYASYDSSGGDSGGLIFYDSGASKVFVLGIHRGSVEINGVRTGAVASKVSNVLTALDISLWQ